MNIPTRSSLEITPRTALCWDTCVQRSARGLLITDGRPPTHAVMREDLLSPDIRTVIDNFLVTPPTPSTDHVFMLRCLRLDTYRSSRLGIDRLERLGIDRLETRFYDIQIIDVPYIIPPGPSDLDSLYRSMQPWPPYTPGDSVRINRPPFHLQMLQGRCGTLVAPSSDLPEHWTVDFGDDRVEIPETAFYMRP